MLNTPKKWQDFLVNRQKETFSFQAFSDLTKALGLVSPECSVITVTGTNGKGSTVKLIEQLLLAHGKKVGSFTSPHLFKVTERISLGGKALDEGYFIRVCQIILDKTKGLPLHFFQFLTLVALWVFKHESLDFMILEVGIGGRLDAVNVVNANYAVFTSIGLDHCERLGSDREAIALEKAGILRPGAIAFCADPDPPITLNKAIETQCLNSFNLGQDYGYEINGSKWAWRGPNKVIFNLPLPSLAFSNVSTALMVYDHIFNLNDLEQKYLYDVISQTHLPGRYEQINKNPDIIVDVAHNPAATFYLIEQLKQSYPLLPTFHLVFSAFQDKDIKGITNLFIGFKVKWYIATLDGERAATLSQLKQALEVHFNEIHISSSIPEAFELAQKRLENKDVIVAFGSFHVVSAVISALAKNEIK